MLWKQGIYTDVWQIVNAAQLPTMITEDRAESPKIKRPAITHIVIAAPWIDTADIQKLVYAYRDITFVVICHSDVGFLQADPGAIQRLKEQAGLINSTHNFYLAGNNERFVEWARAAITPRFLLLPNLYDVETFHSPYRRPHSHHMIRVGCYGAVRPLKNHITAAAAALQIAQTLKIHVEFHLSSGREEGATSSLMAPIREMLSGNRTTLVLDNWRPWPQFRHLVAQMDLLIQPSYTESFNIVTADGIAEGVPSVVSESIDWVPPGWIARADDAASLAKTGIALLTDPHAGVDGQTSLTKFVKDGIVAWKEFLGAKAA